MNMLRDSLLIGLEDSVVRDELARATCEKIGDGI